MDSFEWNKIFGAVLGTGLFVFALKIIGAGLFASEPPAKPGYLIAVAETTAAGAAAAPAEPEVSLGTLMATADKAKGEDDAKACAACHEFTKGGTTKVGPDLYGIVGRGIGTVPGFAYTDGFKTMAGKDWDYDSLNEWLKKPSGFIKGTKMTFSGISNPHTRADVLAYLGSLSDSPVPFPAP